MSETKGEYTSEAQAAIQFWATIYKVQTLVDGGIRLTLDLPEDAIMQMAQLVECKRRNMVLAFTVGSLIYNKETVSAIQTGSKRKSEWTTKEGKGVN